MSSTATSRDSKPDHDDDDDVDKPKRGRPSKRGRRHSPPPGQHPERRIVVIAGAGIAGVSTAYYLAYKYGMASTVIDVTGTVAPGASGKAAGFLALHWNDGTPTQELSRRSFALHQQLADRFGAESIHYRRLECSSVTTTTAASGATSTPKKKRKKLSKAKLEWLESSTLSSWQEVESMGKESNIAQVHPKLLCLRLWEETCKLVSACRLVQGKVVGASHDKGSHKLQGVLLENGRTIPATDLVYACGPWAANVMQGIKGYSVVVQTRTILRESIFFYTPDSDDSALEVFVRPDSTAFCIAEPDDPCTVEEHPGQESVESEKIEELLETIGKFTGCKLQDKRETPGNPNALQHVVKQQACYQPCNNDFLPVIGKLTRRAAGGDGCYMAGGCNSWGILQGPAVGECMADLIMTGQSQELGSIYAFRPSRYRHIQPVPH